MREEVDPRSGADARVAGRASSEWGVLHLDELRDCGLSQYQVSRRVAKGWLHRVYPAVYAVGHRALSQRARFLAAVKSVGEDAVLSHFSAAVLWELVVWDGRHPEVTVPRAGIQRRAGIRVHRSSVLEARDVVRHEGIPVTASARTLVDLAGVVGDKLLRKAVRRALAHRRTSIRQLLATRRRLGRRRGSAALERVLGAAAPTRSELEDIVLDLILDAGLPAPDVNEPLLLDGRRVVPDFRWPSRRLVVEGDSRAWHDNPIARAADAERQAILEASGERVLSVTWRQVVSEPAATITRIRAALDALAPPSRSRAAPSLP